MDFKHLRLCKRIALKDIRCLWRPSAGQPLAAARNCKAGRPVSRQPDEIYWVPLLVTGDLQPEQQSDVTLSSLRQPHQWDYLHERLSPILLSLMESFKWTSKMMAHKGASVIRGYFITLKMKGLILQLWWRCPMNLKIEQTPLQCNSRSYCSLWLRSRYLLSQSL